MCVFYLGFGMVSKSATDREVKQMAARQGIHYSRYLSTPTPLNNMLWYVILEDTAGFHLGYRSFFDRDTAMTFTWFPRNENLLKPVEDEEDTHRLIRFSQGYYTVEKWGDSTLVFNDLRFGQMIGWNNPQAGFVFHYFMQSPDDNSLVIQRGRFSNWNKEAMLSLLRRIAGSKAK
jgi:inner membrane protein